MQTNEEFISDLLDRAKSGEHRQFQFLRSWQEYSKAKKIRLAEKLLVKSIGKSANNLFKQYCRDVATGKADVNKLFAYHSINNLLEFYEEELRIISDMIEEYEYYLAYDNWVDLLFGLQRSLDTLWDHRG